MTSQNRRTACKEEQHYIDRIEIKLVERLNKVKDKNDRRCPNSFTPNLTMVYENLNQYMKQFSFFSDAMPDLHDVQKLFTKAGREEYKNHMIEILEKSTIMPFKRHGSQYQCFYCDNIYILPSELKQHNLEKHERITLGKTTKLWSEIRVTYNIMMDISNLRCRMCNKNISDKNDLKIHFSESHNKIVPDYVLNNIVAFKLSDINNECYLCNKDFLSFGDLVHHMRALPCQYAHNPIPILKEPKFQVPKIKQPKIKDPKIKEVIPCFYCIMKFRTCKERDEHSKIEHYQDFYCDDCSLPFERKEILIRHIRQIHFKERKHVCEICGRAFFESSNFKIHYNAHFNLKPYKCDICKKFFTTAQSLKIHKRIHSDDRRYVCDICGRAFIQRAPFKSHVRRVHNDERKYKCQVCKKAYKEKKCLIKHFRNMHKLLKFNKVEQIGGK